MFLLIKEENPKKEEVKEEKSVVLQVDNKDDQIIDSGCSHHMASEMNNFFKFSSHDRGIVRVGNNATCHIKGIGSITFYGKTNIDVVYFSDLD